VSYQVLARKWRPQRFEEVAGQAHVTTALRNAIRLDRVPHALLFTGPRGVGKTTLARLLARCLNCEKGPTDEPCGECSPCREIAGGTSTDVQEVDAASRTGVDDVRELIEAVRYAAAPGKHRIFVVDEVHMLSTAAFNALLKTLEEPPPRSLFVFATTNPEKIPYTVVSRCQRHDLRRLGSDEIVARLREVAASEKVAISDASLKAVARAGDGSLRDALTLLDQVVAAGGTQVDDERVAAVLDLVDRRLLHGIVAACLDEDPARALEGAARAAAAGIDARRLAGELLQVLRDLVVLRVAPDAAGLVEAGEDDLEELRTLAGRNEEARLRRMFRALLREQEDLAWAPQPFAVLEMALVRLATLPSGEDVAQLLARLDQLERRLAGADGPSSGGGGAAGPGPGGTGGRGGPRRAGAERRPGGKPPAGRRAEATGAGTTGAEAAATGAAPAAPVRPDGPAADAHAADGHAANGSATDGQHATPHDGGDALPTAPLPVVLDRLRGFVQKQERGLAAAMEGGRIAALDEGTLRLAIPGPFAAARLQGRSQALAELCARFFGRPMAVEVEPLEAAPAEGAHADPAAAAELEAQQRREALQHPAVNAALEILEGEIVEIRPVGPPR